MSNPEDHTPGKACLSAVPPIPLLLIVGPTAVGKSALAVAAAARLGGEIVSADSRQLYRGFDIGTAKPTAAERHAVPHHLIDVLPPQQWISVAEYQQMARGAIAAIHQRGRLPLLVGGTGFYVRAVVDGLQFPGVAAQPALRAQLRQDAAAAGAAALHPRLQRLDPVSAARLHPNDLMRVIRALEVIAVTGRPVAELQPRGRDCPYRLVAIGLTADRQELYRRIEARVDAMMAAGLLQETAALWRRFPAGSPLLDTLGYRELIGHLRGEGDLAAAVAAIKLHTRQYAKRQLTWFRSDRRIVWMDAGNCASMSVEVERICALVGECIDDGMIGPH